MDRETLQKKRESREGEERGRGREGDGSGAHNKRRERQMTALRFDDGGRPGTSVANPSSCGGPGLVEPGMLEG